MVKAVLLDLGNTLVRYYTREQFPGVLAECIGSCRRLLLNRGVVLQEEGLWDRVREQDRGSPGNRVYPLEDRLRHIFGVRDEETMDALCVAFTEPIFSLAVLYDDVKPTLEELRGRGVRTAIVSNTPWGSPAGLWRRELDRLGLTPLVDGEVFCRDVGWRKPDPRVFTHALNLLGVEPGDALFVGDDPRWDVEGPRALGMRALLLDRTGDNPDALKGLGGLLSLI